MFNDPLVIRVALTALIVLVCAAGLWLLHRGRALLIERFTHPQGPARRAGRLSLALFGLAILALGAWEIATAWGADVVHFVTARGELGALLRVAVILVFTVAIVEFVGFASTALTDGVIKRTGNRRSAAKLRTVAPLLQGLVNAMIVLMALSMVLSEAGVQVAPLLAGAGIAGIAIGFGAQSLVKDLFTGVFLIVEDIVSRGDVVEIAGVSGTVEAMTLRTIRLRDYDGTLHIFPYGEAQVIHNKTSAFSYFAFELQISYLSDIDQAIAAVEKAWAQLKENQKIASQTIGEIQISGLDKLSDNGMILKGRIKTEPGEQWRVGRAFHPLVKKALDEAGVLIANRQLPVPPYDTIADRAQRR